MLAEVIHFYGFGWDEVLDMDVTWFCKFYQRIPTIQARRLLDWLPVLSYPHMTAKKDRKKLQDDLNRQAGYERMRRYAVTPAQQDDGWARLRGHGRPPVNGTHDGHS